MSQESDNNKRIAKNTVFLYIRMFLTMLVSLYTSRVVLNVLGVSDYGIYNVMGGVIVMLAYVNNLLSGGTSRFLTMDLGRGDEEELKRTFKLSNSLGFAAATAVLLLGETVGLWFMNTQLNIDPVRMDAANWVYQCALASCCLAAIQTPYTASIIAHEKMNIYAYMSIFDVVMKLGIVFLISWVKFDKLKLYALLMLILNLLATVVYFIVCRIKFHECRFGFSFSGKKFKEMMTYSGWNMVTAFSAVLNSYGINILLNIFFGTIVNGARGIASQVGHVVQQFYSNFQTASRPQIMKYYAQDNVEGMSRLICNTSKFSAFLLICLSIPIIFNIDGLLQIWLGQNPEYAAWFIRISLMQMIVQCVHYPIGMGLHAIGKMKVPNLVSGFFYLIVFPFTWVAFKIGAGPILGFCVCLVFTPFALVADLLIIRKYCGFSIRTFIRSVIVPIILIAGLGALISFFCFCFITNNTIIRTLVSSAISAILVSATIFLVGLSKSMRQKIIAVAKTRASQILKH